MALPKVVRSLQGLESTLGPSVVTVGTFDGVHRGHRLLIRRAIEEARRLRVRASAVTWDRHPKSVVPDERAPALLTSIERKIELLADAGLDAVVVLPLDEELTQWSPERFVDEVFVRALGARVVIVGSDWRYGHRAAGDVDLLRRLGQTSNFRVVTLERSGRNADEASSTRARAAVARGQVEAAGALLGRPHELDATVVSRAGAIAEARIGSGFAVPAAGSYRGSLAGWPGRCLIHVDDGDRLRIEAAGEVLPVGASARLQFVSRLGSPHASGRAGCANLEIPSLGGISG